MEVRGHNSDFSLPAKRRFEELRAAIARRDAARVRSARQTLSDLSERRQDIHRAAQEQAAARADSTQRVRDAGRTDEARPTRTADRGHDTIEISDEAREAADLAARAGDDTDRTQRVEELRQAHQAGQLNTPERVERAASRLLGGE